MDGSEYQKIAYGRVEGRVPDVDLQLEVELQAQAARGHRGAACSRAPTTAPRAASPSRWPSAPSPAAPTAARRFADPEAPARLAGRAGRWLGADVDLGHAAAVDGAAGRPDLALFGEAPTRVVVTVAPAKLAALEATARRAAAPRARAG